MTWMREDLLQWFKNWIWGDCVLHSLAYQRILYICSPHVSLPYMSLQNHRYFLNRWGNTGSERWRGQGYIVNVMTSYWICFILPTEYVIHNKDEKIMIILRIWIFRKDVKKKIVFPFLGRRSTWGNVLKKIFCLLLSLPNSFCAFCLSLCLPFPISPPLCCPAPRPEPKLPYSNMIGFWLFKTLISPCRQIKLPARKKTGRKNSAGERKVHSSEGLAFWDSC